MSIMSDFFTPSLQKVWNSEIFRDPRDGSDKNVRRMVLVFTCSNSISLVPILRIVKACPAQKAEFLNPIRSDDRFFPMTTTVRSLSCPDHSADGLDDRDDAGSPLAGDSRDCATNPAFIPHSLSTPPSIFQLFKKGPPDQRPKDPPAVQRKSARAVTFIEPEPRAGGFDPFAAPFDPFSGSADPAVADPVAPEFSGVVDFRPVLSKYIRPPEALTAAKPKVPQMPPLQKFETTIAAQKLADFVRTEFGITAIFGAGRGQANERVRSRAQEDRTVLATV
jgi:hypothetical protein